jgi:hypothetical protein
VTEVRVAFEARSAKRAPCGEPRRYPARIARALALAHDLQRRLDAGEFRDFADMARALGFTRARITQIMDLLLLAPDLQEEILFLDLPLGMPGIQETKLRALTKCSVWAEQRTAWASVR